MFGIKNNMHNLTYYIAYTHLGAGAKKLYQKKSPCALVKKKTFYKTNKITEIKRLDIQST